MQGEDFGGRPATANPPSEDTSLHRPIRRSPIDPHMERRFRRLVRRVHALGPRALGELLLKASDDRHRLLQLLERFAGIDLSLLLALAGYDWHDILPRLVT